MFDDLEPTATRPLFPACECGSDDYTLMHRPGYQSPRRSCCGYRVYNRKAN